MVRRRLRILLYATIALAPVLAGAACRRGETPHDYAGLVALIRRGEFVEAPALGEDFILYGVGENASDEPFTHYDRATGKSVTLYATDAELEQEHAQLDEAVKQHEEAIKALAEELKAAP